MGAWGLGFFENDDALDWVAELRESSDSSPLEKIFEQSVANLDSHDVFVEIAVLAAAEILTHAHGRGDEELPDEAQDYLKRSELGDLGTLTDKAIESTRMVLAESELKNLWEETGEGGEWKLMVKELIERLQRNYGPEGSAHDC